MKNLPHLLAAAALIGGVGVLSGTPAYAKDKPAAAQPGALVVSKEFREQAIAADAQAKAIQAQFAAKDPGATAALTSLDQSATALEAAAKTDDERYVAAAVRLNVARLRLNVPGTSEQTLRAPLDTLIANAKTPPADQANYNYDRAVLAYNARDFKSALTYLDRAQQLGNTNPNIPLMAAKARLAGGDAAGGSAALEQSIAASSAAGGKATEQTYRFAIAQSAKGNNPAATIGWIQKYLAAYPTRKNWRDMTVAWGIQSTALTTLEKREKLDLYRMLRSGNALVDEYDYLNYALMATEVGLPFEARTVLAEGQRAGKITATNADAKRLSAAATASIANDGTLASLETRARAGNGRLALAAADANLGSDNYTKAIEFYRLALQKGGVDANEVNLRLGIAQAKSGDKEGARATFASVTTAPYSGVGALWTTFLDSPPVA